MPDRINILLDFDGTISLRDTTDLILEAFAHPQWRDVEREWVHGRIGSRDCMSRQVALMHVSPAMLDQLVDQIEVDPHFPSLVQACQATGVSLTIASDGFDRVILRVLARLGLCVPVIANRLIRLPHDRWTLEFPNASSVCGAGSCKCRAALMQPGSTVLVGDGRSDFCVAEAATVVFAKDKLAAHCSQTGRSFLPLPNLSVVTHWLADAGPTFAEKGRSGGTSHCQSSVARP